MSDQAGLRALILPLQDTSIILPHVAVAEIIGYRELEDIDKQVDGEWILGLTNWYGFRIPVISFERLVDKDFTEPGQKAKIAICNMLDKDQNYPAVGIVVEAIPRLLLIDSDEQLLAGDYSSDIAMSALYKGQSVWIPDMEKLCAEINTELETETA